MDYNKKHYKQFKVDLKIDEMENLEKMLKEDKISKASFLRDAIKDYERNRLYKECKKIINKRKNI